MSSVCLSVPRESSYNLPPIPTSQLDFDGTYIGYDPTPHLWPPGPRDKAPGSIRSVTAGFGAGLDRGALRRLPSSRWEMLEFGGVWIPWKPTNRDHYLAASAFNRYGVGWSFGPAHNLHDEAYGKWEELCGSPPEPIQKWDIDYSLQLWRQLDSEWRAKFGQVIEPNPTQPTNPAPKPVDPKPQPTQPKPEPSRPQEPSMPVSTTTTNLDNIHNEIRGARIDISDAKNDIKDYIGAAIDSAIEATSTLRNELTRDINSEIHAHVLHERQWWHDNIQPLVDDFMNKRPALAERLGRLLNERKVE